MLLEIAGVISASFFAGWLNSALKSWIDKRFAKKSNESVPERD